MHLSLRVSEGEALALPALVSLMRAAPAFEIQGTGREREYVATFPALPEALDLAVRVIGEVVAVPGARAAINRRAVVNLTKFWTALICYRDSLWEEEPQTHCARQASRVGDEAGCPARTCHARCPFICARCLQVVREQGAVPVAEQLRQIAERAEVDWCPNLRFSVTSIKA